MDVLTGGQFLIMKGASSILLESNRKNAVISPLLRSTPTLFAKEKLDFLIRFILRTTVVNYIHLEVELPGRRREFLIQH